MSNKIYDIAKYIVQIALPATTTLIASISTLYNYDATIVIGIMSAVTVFLGSLIGITSINYNHKQNPSITGLEDNPSVEELISQNKGE